MAPPLRRFCIAPMMGLTHRHGRYAMRLLSRRAMLYTEMVTAQALLQGDAGRHLAFHPAEPPLALQLGGSDPKTLAACAAMAEAAGFSEVNLNVGCPSHRVKSGRMGACLMAEPERVAECVAAMRARVAIPVTVKHRIGIDRQGEEDLHRFVETVSQAGCRTFIVHARKAWLAGLDPRANRTVPPLEHARVYALKAAFPGLEIITNGGIASLEEADRHLQRVDGVMMGRAAFADPWLIAQVDSHLFGAPPPVETRKEAVARFLPYMARALAQGVPFSVLARPLQGLFKGLPGARTWRRLLGEGRGPGDVERALAAL